jgi:CDP-paratose 2-epimerase
VSIVLITGSAGLVGSEAAEFFAGLGFDVVGIDNNMRQQFFGNEASTEWNQQRLKHELGQRYHHQDFDIRDEGAVRRQFARMGKSVALVIHTAAQPSHDWAAV